MIPLRGHLPPRILSALMDGELDLLDLREARLHLSRCRECREEIGEFEEVDRALALSREEARPRPGLQDGLVAVVRHARGAAAPRARRPSVAPYALAAATVIAAVSLLWASSLRPGATGGEARDPSAVSSVVPAAEEGPRPIAFREIPVEPEPIPPAPVVRVESTGPPAPPRLVFRVDRPRGDAAELPLAMEDTSDPACEVDLALNPEATPVVQMEEKAASLVGEGRSGRRREGILWSRRTAISFETALDADPVVGSKVELRPPADREMARDLASAWLGSSEERLDYVVSVAYEVAHWN